MGAGSFSIPRGELSNPIFGNPRREPLSKGAAWIWLVENAAFAPMQISIEGQVADLARGELSHSILHLVGRWGWTTTKIQNFVQTLIQNRLIVIRKIGRQNVISICDYDRFSFRKTAENHDGQPIPDAYWKHNAPGKKEIKQDISSEAKASSDSSIPESMVGVWREECGDALRVPTKLNPTRLKACKARWRDSFGKDLENWRAHCRSIRGSPFLCGETEGKGNWKADFDWALTPKAILGVQEGKYASVANDGPMRSVPTGPPPLPEDIWPDLKTMGAAH